MNVSELKICPRCHGPVSPTTRACSRGCGYAEEQPPAFALPPLPMLDRLAPIINAGMKASVLPPLPSLAVSPPSGAKPNYVANLIHQVNPVRVLLADPPWEFGDKLPGGGRGAEKHYKTMSIEDIKKFPLPPLAENAVLFLWRVEALEADPEGCYSVARAWGFTPKSKITWVKTVGEHEKIDGRVRFKTKMGMGRYTRRSTEDCIIAVRSTAKASDCHPAVHDQLDWFPAPIAEHSAKPDKLYEIIERMYPEGVRCELFARRRRDGWIQYGDELPPEGQP